MRRPFRRASASDRTPDATMSLTDHLQELRFRIIRCALAVVIAALVIIIFYDQVLDFLLEPYEKLCSRRPDLCTEGAVLNIFDPLEGLTTRLRVGTYGGLIVALPVILWQIWRFVVPALHAKEKKYAIPFIISSVLLFLLGATIAYLTLEKALEFLVSWAGEGVQPTLGVAQYIRLVGLMMAAFGVGFEVPVLLVFLQLVGVLTPQTLIRGWRYAIVAIFVLAAVITPSGDPISLIALAGPLIVLYALSVLVGWLFQRAHRRASRA